MLRKKAPREIMQKSEIGVYFTKLVVLFQEGQSTCIRFSTLKFNPWGWVLTLTTSEPFLRKIMIFFFLAILSSTTILDYTFLRFFDEFYRNFQNYEFSSWKFLKFYSIRPFFCCWGLSSYFRFFSQQAFSSRFPSLCRIKFTAKYAIIGSRSVIKNHCLKAKNVRILKTAFQKVAQSSNLLFSLSRWHWLIHFFQDYLHYFFKLYIIKLRATSWWKVKKRMLDK